MIIVCSLNLCEEINLYDQCLVSRHMGNHTAVKKLMTEDLATESPQTSISAATETLLGQEAGSLVILENGNQISGIITCTDLAGLVAKERTSTEETVKDYMSTDVITISPEESIQDAAVKMITKGIQHLPVTNSEDEVIGMLSTTDLTNHLTFMDSIGTY